MVESLNERKFKLFISNDKDDKDEGTEIQRYLNNNCRDIQCYLETDFDIESQTDKFKIIKLIRECDVYILLMSRNSRSPKGWLKYYLRWKCSEALNFSKKINLFYLFLDDPNIFSTDYLRTIREIPERTNYTKKIIEILPESQEFPINYKSLSSSLKNLGVRYIDDDAYVSEYDVFISYNFDDAIYAEQVYKSLTEEGLKVFMSEISLPSLKRDEYRKYIVLAIKNSNHMVIVTSSRSNITSKWVEYEWGLFLNALLSGDKKGNLLIVLAGNMEPKDLPFDLSDRQAIALQPDKIYKLIQYVK